jgi:hypothetical protein
MKNYELRITDYGFLTADGSTEEYCPSAIKNKKLSTNNTKYTKRRNDTKRFN